MNIEKYTPLYTDFDIQYQQEYSGPYEPLDFAIPAALKQGRISGYGRPLVGDLPKPEIERLYNVSNRIWYLDYLDNGLSNVSKFLLQKGHEPRPYFTQIIDLTKSEAELHADVRKSYKSLINKPVVISMLSDVEPLRKLHIQVHGRETRSKQTWFLQQRMMWEKQAFTLLQSKFLHMRDPFSDVPLAGAFIYYNREICYYGVGCSVEGAGSHALIWQAILHTKKLGCKQFDMGQQVFGGGKLENISKFKRGFGGQTKVYLEFK